MFFCHLQASNLKDIKVLQAAARKKPTKMAEE
jgi:hypothetical protein